jgi:hypothetical protein
VRPSVQRCLHVPRAGLRPLADKTTQIHCSIDRPTSLPPRVTAIANLSAPSLRCRCAGFGTITLSQYRYSQQLRTPRDPGSNALGRLLLCGALRAELDILQKHNHEHRSIKELTSALPLVSYVWKRYPTFAKRYPETTTGVGPESKMHQARRIVHCLHVPTDIGQTPTPCIVQQLCSKPSWKDYVQISDLLSKSSNRRLEHSASNSSLEVHV